MERIVVGVDGSAGADRALRWAVDEAARHGAELEVVTSWHFPALAALPLPAPSLHELIARGRTTQDDALDRVGPPSTLPIDRSVVQGHPVGTLLSAAADADLLVVGRGGGRGRLGSTSSRCAMHATCDVVVVP
jgi:nucleotide-binding universal stress UspA family protein